MQKSKIYSYSFSVPIVLMIGYAGTFFTTPSIPGWYATLTKPSFNPPNWIFGPVWTLLYLLIGISLGMVLSAPKVTKYRTAAIASFAVQLALNLLWSFTFFYLHRSSLAAVEILILLASIVVNIYYTDKVRKASARLLIPYLLWVSFATILSIAIWQLNS